MKNIFFKSLTAVYFGLSISAFAQTNPNEFERTEVLDKPRYSLTGRFHFDTGFTFLPLDAYYKPILIEGALSYQFSDWFSWEIARGGYSIHNYNTGLKNSIDAEFAAIPSTKRLVSGQQFKDLRYRAGSTAFFNLLYSKSNWFNRSIVYHYWQVGAGMMYYDFKHKNQIAADLALRVRFFINNQWLIDLRGGHSIGFKSKAPRQIMHLGMGVGLAF